MLNHNCSYNQKTQNLKSLALFGPILGPMDQFEIRDFLCLDAAYLVNLHTSLTNIGLFLIITAYIAIILYLLATNYNKVIANYWSIIQESTYATIHSIVINQINANKGQMYFPYVCALFIFILTLVLFTVALGIYPASVLDGLHYSVTTLIYSLTDPLATGLCFLATPLNLAPASEQNTDTNSPQNNPEHDEQNTDTNSPQNNPEHDEGD